jgi:hypothetical protein
LCSLQLQMKVYVSGVGECSSLDGVCYMHSNDVGLIFSFTHTEERGRGKGNKLQLRQRFQILLQ